MAAAEARDRGMTVTLLSAQERTDLFDNMSLESRYNSVEIRQQEPRQLFDWPDDDICVTIQKKQERTKQPVVTPDMKALVAGTPVEMALDVFTQDFLVVQKTYETYDGVKPEPGFEAPPPFNDEEWPDKKALKEIFLSVEILRSYKPEDDARDKQRRQEAMCNSIYRVFSDVPNLPASDPRVPFPPLESSSKGTQLLVDCTGLSFAIGDLEPYFVSAALYDLAKRRRVSEYWNFDLNNAEQRAMLGSYANTNGLTSPTAIFSVSQVSSEICLIVRVEKVYKAVELETDIATYLKGPAIKAKEKDKIMREAEARCPRIGHCRQPFAWGAIVLFGEDKNLVVGTATQCKLQRHKPDDSEQAFIEMAKKQKDVPAKDKKSIPAEFTFNFKIVSDPSTVEGKIDPSLHKVDPFPPNSKIVREIQELMESKSRQEPMVDYVNNLYVIPEAVNLSKHKEATCKNIFARVRVKTSDADVSGEGQKVIYGSSLEDQFVTEARTPVTYHKKNPNFCSEAKIKLDPRLGPEHHLLFTFHNCSASTKKQSGEIENYLGFAAIPLFNEGKIVESGRMNVPVASASIPSYMSPDAEANLRWIDNKKAVFTFRTEIVSSVFAEDDNLSEFFRQCYAGADSKHLTMALKKLRNVEQHIHVRHFPIAFSLLFKIICSPSASQAKEAFESLVVVAYSVATAGSQGGRSERLSSWVAHNFRNIAAEKKVVCQEVLSLWVKMLKSADPLVPKSLQLAWFLLEIIMKSMTLYLNDKKLLNANRDRSNEFPSEFQENLKQLIAVILLHLNRSKGQQADVAYATALFLKDGFGVLDRGLVLSLVNQFISRMDPRNSKLDLSKVKFQCLRILCDFRHYVPLNMPVSVTISEVPQIMHDFMSKFTLAGLCLTECANAIGAERTLQGEAIKTLLHVLRKHDLDPRYQAADAKLRIANMYFPLTLLLNDQVPVIEQAEENQKRQLFSCLVFVLQCCDRTLVRTWWKKDTQKNLLAFLTLLENCVCILQGDHMIRESSLVILDIVEDFMVDLDDELKQENSRLLDALFDVLMGLLRKKQTVSAYSCLLATCRRFMHHFKHVIFANQNTTFCGDMCYELLRLTNSVNATTRAEAGSLIYLMIKTNFSTTKNFARMKLQSTIAVSRLCGEASFKSFQHLQKTLEYVARLSKKEFPDDPTQMSGNLGKQVEDLTNRLFKVISDSMKISEFSFDPEMTADLYYRVSLGYTDSPVLRITWLENLARFHRESGNFEEVAQCKFCIAALISEYLVRLGDFPGVPQSVNDFVCLSPNILGQPKLPAFNKDSGEEGLFNSKLFTEDGLLETLTQAIEELKKGGRYETCIDVYNMLLEMHQSHRNYQKLAACFRDLKQVCDQLCGSNQGHSRLFACYYRVGFYGKGWKDQHNKEYIYKESSTVRLADFSQRIQGQFSQKYGADKIKMLPNKQVNMAELDAELLYLQIVSVEPYFTEEELQDRLTEWDRYFNLTRFMYESPFTVDGKSHGDISSQCKRKTILTVDRCFPYVKKRCLVQDTTEEILSPLENAIETIQNRERALRRELNMSPPNLKTLQINLQGAVLAQVNAGPIEIARTFLGPKASGFPRHHIDALSQILSEFLNMCAFALKLNKTLIGVDQLEFQTECEKGYDALRDEVQGLITQTAGLTLNYR